MNIHQKERIFFFTHVIPILSLFIYSVCYETVKIRIKYFSTNEKKKLSAKKIGGKFPVEWPIYIYILIKRE